jgi:hypothetical protein
LVHGQFVLHGVDPLKSADPLPLGPRPRRPPPAPRACTWTCSAAVLIERVPAVVKGERFERLSDRSCCAHDVGLARRPPIVRTCAPMQRERSQAAQTARIRVPMRSTGAEQLVVGTKAL